MPTVVLTHALPGPADARLRDAGFDVVTLDADGPPTREAVLDAVAGATGLVTLLSDRVDAALLDAAGPSLRVVANYAVGLDNVDLDACRARGVAVAHTPDVLSDATADMAWALLLAVARRVVEGDALVRSGRWGGWAPDQLLGTSLSGRRFGVVGFGRIGQAAARRATGFGMDVVYAARTPKPEAEAALGAQHLPLETLLRTADVVSLHTPGTPETHHLIDAAALDAMKPTALLINTARGTVIDEAALVAALRSGAIAGAGLDVFEREPALAAGLADLPNVVLAPHLGSATTDTRAEMAGMVADAVIAVAAGGTVPHLAVAPTP